MTSVTTPRKPASPILELRSPVEFWAYVASNPLLRLAPKGQGRPVLVLPGFTATDTSTVPLRMVLRQLKHDPVGWGLGRNMGPTTEKLVGVRELLEQMVDDAGAPVPVVGWSLGGVYARLVAQEHPDLVEQVISLGSPFNFGAREHSTLTPLWDYLASRSDFVRDADNVDLDQIPVPSTSIFTRTDGVVAWRSCVQSEGPFAENVEVRGSHIGLGVNVAATFVLADRLANCADGWEPFTPRTRINWLFPRRRGRQ